MGSVIPRRRWVFFIDPIEESSYPVTETGYAMLYRAWCRAKVDGDEVYVVYPSTPLSFTPHRTFASPRSVVLGRRLIGFSASPYEHFRSQRDTYDAAADVGSLPCHEEGPPTELILEEADVIVFRQETGEPVHRRRLLRALAKLESRVLVYLSPRLALDPEFGSKVLPGRIAPECVPVSWSTTDLQGSRYEKVDAALEFLRGPLKRTRTAIVKPAFGDNGEGITVLGVSPLDPYLRPRNARDHLIELLQRHGEVVVQEYVPSVRAPRNVEGALDQVPLDRCDFGEIRFLLIDGTVPRDRAGCPILVARRTPTPTSLLADSGISYPTTLSDAERRFLDRVGQAYLRYGIHFGGGDLIRTANPERPFVFTDAARAVCGHAVVTGALNGEPYLIVDQVLDSMERHWIRRVAERRTRVA
ncbi:MAG: hypothetical protein AAGA48_12160 [Myxococcota bacterium]